MSEQKRKLYQDTLWLLIVIATTLLIAEAGLVQQIVLFFGPFTYLGIFISGIFFTSAFTTPAAIALLASFAAQNNIADVALVGAAGAAVGDYAIFRFVKDRIADDVKYLLQSPKADRLRSIFHTRLVHRLAPFIGALIIASPLPDEIGITMLGLARVDKAYFILLTFVMNVVGIMFIGLIAQHAL